MANIIDGKELAQTIKDKIALRIKTQKINPGLAVVLVGNDPASHTYVSLKQTACEEAVIRFEKFIYPEYVKTEELIDKIKELNAREEINGILVQLPLPTGHDTDVIIDAIDPNKDVDGFHKTNMRLLKEGKPGIAPAVALGIMKILDSVEAFVGNHAVVVSSELFAEPLVTLLSERKVYVDHVFADDANLKTKTKEADILIVAAGKPGLITADHVKSHAVVIDVGTTKINGHIVGDVDEKSVIPVAGWLTPVPGGVGPMTVAMLLVNVLKAYNLQEKK
ncbi:MAG: bifunctional 5,10-methylenetetrahydrofolate dehydrogenase/5,10-methenyltetrahydrofolate cyclohydrolase [Patescibacteria group bacterium]